MHWVKFKSLDRQLELVFLGMSFSIGSYFLCSNEPPFWMLWGVGLFSFCALPFPVLRCFLFGVGLGCFALVWRLSTCSVTLLNRPLSAQQMTGTIVQIIPRTPYTCDVRLNNIALKRHLTTPFQGDVLLRNTPFHDAFVIGQDVSGWVTLRSIPTPSEPGGYPISQEYFFKGIAAEGKGYIKVAPTTSKQTFSLWRTSHRREIANKIQSLFKTPHDGLITALVLGEKTLIPPAIKEIFATSGLSHLLAISGLHMSLVATFLFFMIRRFLACFSSIAEAYDTKRPTALLTFLFLSYYTIYKKNFIE